MSELLAAADPHPGVQFYEHLHLWTWRPRGILDEVMVDNIIKCVKATEDKVGEPFNRFTDLSAIDAIDLHFKYVFHAALHRRLRYMQHPPIKSAFYVTNAEVAHHVKVYALVCDHSPLQVAMFKERVAAAKWLDVPIEFIDQSPEVTRKD